MGSSLKKGLKAHILSKILLFSILFVVMQKSLCLIEV